MDSEASGPAYLPGLEMPKKPPRKPPRKPRPSEIAAKKAKAAKKKPPKRAGTKKKAVKTKKPAKKTATAKKPRGSRAVKTKRKPGKPKVRPVLVERCERLDIRLTKKEKAKIAAKAKKLGWTITSVIVQAIKNIR